MCEVLSLARMARRAGVTQQWLKAEAEAGRVPCLVAGNRFLFSSSVVLEVLSQRASCTTSKVQQLKTSVEREGCPIQTGTEMLAEQLQSRQADEGVADDE